MYVPVSLSYSLSPSLSSLPLRDGANFAMILFAPSRDDNRERDMARESYREGISRMTNAIHLYRAEQTSFSRPLLDATKAFSLSSSALL